MHGRILKKLRESRNVTQASIARSVGISPAQMARLESNQRGLYLEDFILIAEALGEKPGNLLPNDLGDIGHLKPLIDRLLAVRPELLGHVTAIIESIILLSEEALAAKPPNRSVPPGRKSRATASRKVRR